MEVLEIIYSEVEKLIQIQAEESTTTEKFNELQHKIQFGFELIEVVKEKSGE